MKNLAQIKIIIQSVFILATGALVCIGFAPLAEAVSPPPDGGYPGGNTAEGQNALQALTTGGYNTAAGWYSLWSVTDGSLNTAIGAGALVLNAGGGNTAVGAAALLLNTSGSSNVAVGSGALLYNDTGFNNNAFGSGALYNNTDGFENTAVGASALFNNTTGGLNNAFGNYAMFSRVSGDYNNAVGGDALYGDQSGSFNNGFGDSALASNIIGTNNTAVGDQALFNSTGNDNTALGATAGMNLNGGSGNVYIGASVMAASGQENNHTYIRNINTTTVSGGGTDSVTVDLTTGLLGHLTSSRRYKEEIKPMDKASETLYRLKPVIYRFKKEINATQNLDYGLVAEEVAEVDPNLAIRDGKGQIESVRYTAINAMLLNEFLKEHRKVEEQEAMIAQLKKDFQIVSAQQHEEIQLLSTQLKEQAVQIQKVTAQLEMAKPAAQTVLNNP